ncbi:hypothetical protein LEN26_018483 [Aphanomyces euteiches]|nr:hypothetical protein LEN26_018483 [Aphanomyces euteiches]
MSSMEAAAIDEAPWDIQADLSFLFDISNTAVAGDVSTKVKSGSVDAVQSKFQPRGNPSEARQRAKRMELLREIEILTKQLADIKRKTCITEDMTRWKNVARRLRCESQKAVKDRRSLLEAIHANELFIAKMTALARKKPSVQPALVFHANVDELPADPRPRKVALHAIADHQHSRKDMEFIKAGLVDQVENILQVHHSANLSERTLKHEYASNMTLAAPYEVVGRALWQAFRGGQASSMPRTAQAYEKLDSHTLYERFRDSRHGVKYLSNLVLKYFVDTREHVLVFCSIPRDERVSEATNFPLEKQAAWVSVEPVDAIHCRVSFLLQVVLKANATSSGRKLLDEMLTSDETCHLQAALPEGGLYDVPLHFPRCVQEMPGYDMFAEHSTHMKKALLDSVNAAVRDFHRQRVWRTI